MCEVPYLEALPGWFELRAVRQGGVALCDGNRYFNRSGVTIVETVEILAEIVHGLSGDHRGDAWCSYDDIRDSAIEKAHASARAGGYPSYIDPKTGYSVFTVDFLKHRGFCCSSGCRHCPFGFVAPDPVTRTLQRR
jgi:hypothetical protein